MKKRSRRIGAMSSEQFSVKNQFWVKIYCSIHPTQLTVNFDSSFVNGDPLRLRLRRVGNAVSDLMYPLPDRLMRAFYAEESENFLCLSERTTGRVEPDGKRPDGRRRPLSLPTFKIRGF